VNDRAETGSRPAPPDKQDAIDRERHEVGQALHDTVCQSLGGIAILVKLLARRVKNGQGVAVEELDELACMTDRALEEARVLSRKLLPVQLESAGLMSALEELATETARTTPCVFVCETPVFVGDAPSALALYRTAEEAVRRLLDATGTTAITIKLSEQDGEPAVRVSADR